MVGWMLCSASVRAGPFLSCKDTRSGIMSSSVQATCLQHMNPWHCAEPGDLNLRPVTSVPQAYVWRNNVYVKASPGTPAARVTETGQENQLLNGIPDWVYEGERF